MKTYELKRAGEVLAEIVCEEIQMGKNPWLAKIKSNRQGLIASLYLAENLTVVEKPAPDKSSPVSVLPSDLP